MKKSDIKEGVTYQTKTGMAARKVLEITSDRDKAKQQYRWLGEADPPFVIYQQVRGPGAVDKTVSALSMTSFAAWAHILAAEPPATTADLRKRVEALEDSLAEVLALARTKYGNLHADVNETLDRAAKLLEKTP